MAREFQRGHKAKISDLTAGTDLYVGVHITAPGLAFDICCFGLDEDERLSDDRYFVFFNQPKSPEEALQLLGPQAGDTESFRVTLDKIPPRIQRLSFTASIDGAGHMSQIGSGYLRIVAGGEEVARYPFSGPEFTTEGALVLGDFYMKDVWRFAAVGQGFDGGLDTLLKNFGGEIAEEQEAAEEAEDGAPGFAPPTQGGPVPAFAPPTEAAAPPAFAVPAPAAPAPASPAPAAPEAPAPEPYAGSAATATATAPAAAAAAQGVPPQPERTSPGGEAPWPGVPAVPGSPAVSSSPAVSGPPAAGTPTVDAGVNRAALAAADGTVAPTSPYGLPGGPPLPGQPSHFGGPGPGQPQPSGQTASLPPGYGQPRQTASVPTGPSAPPLPPGHGRPEAVAPVTPAGYGSRAPGPAAAVGWEQQPAPTLPPGYGQSHGVTPTIGDAQPAGGTFIGAFPTASPYPGAGQPQHPGQPWQGAGVQGVMAALQPYREAATGQRWTQQNKKLVRVDLAIGDQPVLARQGSMVLHQGKVDFGHQGAGFTGRIMGNATGQEVQMMRCSGHGQVFFAEDAAHLHPVELQGDAICVSAEHVLAFDESLRYEVRRIQAHGIPGGVLFTLEFQGTGTVVVKTHGTPVVLPVTPTTFADCNAAVAWSAASQVVIAGQARMRTNAHPGASGESTTLQFRGAPGNFIVVQPYEV